MVSVSGEAGSAQARGEIIAFIPTRRRKAKCGRGHVVRFRQDDLQFGHVRREMLPGVPNSGYFERFRLT